MEMHIRILASLVACTAAAVMAPAYGGPVRLAPNDDCATAEPLSPGESRSGDNILAVDDYAARDGSGANAQDVVFTFELQESSQVAVDVTGSDYQIDLYIRRVCEDPGTEVAFVSRTDGEGLPPFDSIFSQPPPKPLLANLPAGRYYLFLDADNGAGIPYRLGEYSVRLDVTTPAAGDRCEDAIAMTSSGSLTGSTTRMVDDYRSTSGGIGGRDIAFAITAPEPQTIVIDPAGSTFDTVLYARTDCDDPATEFAAADDDGASWQGALEVTLPAGISYVILDGWDRSSAGTYTVTVR